MYDSGVKEPALVNPIPSADVWFDVWESGGEWRNQVVHGGYQASFDEAVKALRAVRKFVEFIEHLLRQ